MNPTVTPGKAPASWRYATPAIVLHWTLAVFIAFMAGLGWWMMTIEKTPEGPWWFDLHKSLGLILFTLVLLRVVWRAIHAPAPLPASLPRWQVLLSHATQWLMYLGMLAIPAAGILGASHQKAGLAFFGTRVPLPFAPDRALSHTFFNLHETLVWAMVALLALHVAGGLKHRFIDRDDVFGRMWPKRLG